MKILLVYNHNRSFVHRDIDILSKKHRVTSLYYKREKEKLNEEIKKNDVVISWFASKHTLNTFRLAKKHNKKTIVIVGGFDASDIKGYGMFSSFIRRKIVSYIYKNSDLILPVDKSLADVITKYLPEVSNKIKVVPTGYDYNYFKPKGDKKKQVLTVCYVDKTNWWRKGLLTLMEVAKQVPNISFKVVGKISEDVQDRIRNSPKNVEFLGWLSDEDLLKMYQESKVFALLSKYEGLPNVVCEAMLCGCVPVGTNVCGIPNAIGDNGFLTQYGDVNDATLKIKYALNAPRYTQEKARKHVQENFSVKQREEKIKNVIGELFLETK